MTFYQKAVYCNWLLLKVLAFQLPGIYKLLPLFIWSVLICAPYLHIDYVTYAQAATIHFVGYWIVCMVALLASLPKEDV